MTKRRPKSFLLPVQAVSVLLAGRLLAAGEGADPSKAKSPEAPESAVASSSSKSSPIVFGVTVDRTEVSVGDSLTVTYAARIPQSSSLKLDTLVTPEPPEGERPPGGTVLEYLPPTPPVIERWDGKEGAALWKQSITIIPFMAGTVLVPGPHFAFEERKAGDAPGSSVDVRPPSVTLQVASRLPKDAKPDTLAPKDDRPVRLPGPSLLFRLGLTALALLLLGALWWWILRRRRAKATGGEAAPTVPPGEELLAELERLAQEAEVLGDDPRAFYTGLTRAVKRYLERRLMEPVLEWTSFETVRRLREKGVEFPKETGLVELLSAADVVKFGRGRSTREAALDHVSRARRLHDGLEAQLTPSPAAPASEKAS